MKYLSAAALLLLSERALADLCSEGSTDAGGNWYCQAVHAITYTNVGGSGSYNKISGMDSNSGTCSSTPQGYSGALSPLDEEVSMHFRGPMALKQFAVYTPSGSTTKTRRNARERRHAHGHAHQHLHEAREAAPEADADAAPVEERQLGAEVFATIDGKLVSWANDWSGLPTSPAAPAPAAAAPTGGSSGGSGGSGGSSPASPPSSGGGSSHSSGGSTNGGWGRQAYYNSEQGTAEGLVFLNHFGGAGSGVFDYSFGNSLSYASADGAAGAASPQTLADMVTKSSTEVVIFSDQKCENGDCGFVRPGTVAHHGFSGPSKAFFFEFGMPSDGQTGASKYDAVDMPAIWMLNAQIPRTLQYGNPSCSCWPGCGEFDIFEVLAAGDSRCKSTLHGNIAGGDSDYFDRPFSGTKKAALLMYNDNIHIKMLDDDTDFGESMDPSFLNNIADGTMSQGSGISLFALAGALAGKE